ncbi:MAG: ABC transporter ATP-binding protein [Candidatus Curtissbacteria bacterium]|nr:ABC transporter ATP-binding protein [Candidatus Curtissbacteria bacterium]
MDAAKTANAKWRKMLKIKNLKASVSDKEILKGVDLEVGSGQIHVLMGPNGSGKSTLAQVIAGHPNYKVVSGKCIVNSQDITKLAPDKRAKLGIFLGFQHPVEVPGVSVFNFLRKAKTSNSLLSLRAVNRRRSNLKTGKQILNQAFEAVSPQAESVQDDDGGIASSFVTPRNDSAKQFRDELKKYMSELKLPEDFLRRSLNEGFSGGEKKRNEILQMMALKPKLVILDEIDSGLDVDGLKLVASAIKQFTINNRQSSIILITHYARILKYLKPDFVHVMVDGQIIKSGKAGLAQKVEEKGYGAFTTMSS